MILYDTQTPEYLPRPDLRHIPPSRPLLGKTFSNTSANSRRNTKFNELSTASIGWMCNNSSFFKRFDFSLYAGYFRDCFLFGLLHLHLCTYSLNWIISPISGISPS